MTKFGLKFELDGVIIDSDSESWFTVGGGFYCHGSSYRVGVCEA